MNCIAYFFIHKMHTTSNSVLTIPFLQFNFNNFLCYETVIYYYHHPYITYMSYFSYQIETSWRKSQFFTSFTPKPEPDKFKYLPLLQQQIDGSFKRKWILTIYIWNKKCKLPPSLCSLNLRKIFIKILIFHYNGYSHLKAALYRSRILDLKKCMAIFWLLTSSVKQHERVWRHEVCQIMRKLETNTSSLLWFILLCFGKAISSTNWKGSK